MSHPAGVCRLWGMEIAIVGGTGTLGRRVTEELRGRGHQVRVLSRHAPDYQVDLTTGAGLAEALAGCQVVVDASNNASRTAAATLAGGTRRLLAAGQAAGVAHHVCVSVIGCERVPLSYFRVKAEQEDAVGDGPVPWTIVRAAQFHEYIAAVLGAAARYGVIPVPRAVLQPVASEEVARAVADAAAGGARRDRVSIAGPEVADLRDLARTWRRAAGRRAALVPLPLPGGLGRALCAASLTDSHPDVRGGLTFAAWAESALAGRPATRDRPAGLPNPAEGTRG
jgi:uncharacterized protein YbjT (DUF2867 family)